MPGDRPYLAEAIGTFALCFIGGGAICADALTGGVWTAHWIYWVGPIAGGELAALVYDRAFLRGGEVG